LNVSPIDINPEEPVEVEFKLLNTGSVPLEVPVSPDLSYLQPADESIPFTYSSLALVTKAKSEQQAPALSSVGYVQLYGAGDHKESMLTLKPGEWIRVRGEVKLWACPSEPVASSLQGEFWLRSNKFRPHPGGSSTEINNLYPNATPTPATAVHFLCASK